MYRAGDAASWRDGVRSGRSQSRIEIATDTSLARRLRFLSGAKSSILISALEIQLLINLRIGVCHESDCKRGHFSPQYAVNHDSSGVGFSITLPKFVLGLIAAAGAAVSRGLADLSTQIACLRVGRGFESFGVAGTG